MSRHQRAETMATKRCLGREARRTRGPMSKGPATTRASDDERRLAGRLRLHNRRLRGRRDVADRATHLLGVPPVHLALQLRRRRGRRDGSLVVVLREQRKHEVVLELLAGALGQVVDVPHDHLVAGAVSHHRRLVRMWRLPLQRGVPLLFLHQGIDRVVRHPPRVSGLRVDAVELGCASVEEQPLHLVQLGEREVVASLSAEAALPEEPRVELPHRLPKIAAR
mmetsp:Transcript_85205/g.245965  ORF Transcript_85205/g.245965 Transcript_85205/m.245965 type:complete len:223 (+) Transcript_85205:59-727(+)